ncbi:hypothetical protein EG329_009424 [Mollisiaceae sp. DMI_Dod_QoI]|nr:hypothetical protein EG329_009424 [Helotiales sp. DMI_Dod_QoI]
MRFTSCIYSLLTATLAVNALSEKQRPLQDNLSPAMPPPTDSPSTSDPAGGDTVILSDVLGNDRSINIFAGFTRDFATISQSAIMGLPRKPWEDPKDYENLGADAYEGENGEERAQKNLRRFVEQHCVAASPWKEGEKLKTLAGDEIWWENQDGIKMIQPGRIEVSSIASKVHNGEVWILKGVRNYA